MKNVNKYIPIFVVLLVASVIIYTLSQREINQYKDTTSSIFEVEEVYDEVSLQYQTINEAITADYKVVSNKTEVYSCNSCMGFSPYVSVGDEVFKGDTLYFVGSKEYKSDYDGLVSGVEHGTGSVYVDRFDNLVVEVEVPKGMKLEVGATYESSLAEDFKLIQHSNIVDDGYQKHYFQTSKKLTYNDTGELYMYTGQIAENQYTLPLNCLATIDGLYYAKLINESKEADVVELQLGMQDQSGVALLNVGEEYVSCDVKYASKYKVVKDEDDE